MKGKIAEGVRMGKEDNGGGGRNSDRGEEEGPGERDGERDGEKEGGREWE